MTAPAPQRFDLLRWTWNITAAAALIEATPRNTLAIPAAELAKLLWLVRIDREHAATVDLDEPIILAPWPDEPGLLVPIDGWHRIWRAAEEHRVHLAAWVLTEAESAAVRLTRP